MIIQWTLFFPFSFFFFFCFVFNVITRCDTIEKMKGSIERMRKELEDDATFKEIYQFAFTFGLGENQKSLRKNDMKNLDFCNSRI